MHSSLCQNSFIVKEQVGLFKAANNYDIYDPASGQKIIECREPNLGLFTKIFRFTDYKRMTPFEVVISTPDGKRMMTVKRGISIFLSKVEVTDEKGRTVGFFKQKLFSIGGKFDVLDAQENIKCSLQGNWTGWNFKFIRGEQEIASVSKKWNGLGKELLTSADNYVLTVNESVSPDDDVRMLIFAAVMCIDMVLKE
ncbi:MAG: phospholipid scramblase-related protein [Pseudobdellovibrionaceae bacterium]